MQALVEKSISFEEKLELYHISLKRKKLKVLQLNMGRKCNQSCIHCHADAGPDRKEAMSRGTIDRILELLDKNRTIETVDLTGGAPELNPNFRYAVRELRRLNRRVIDRSNLTVLFEEGLTDLPEFLAANQVGIIASLPCYIGKNVDSQRGEDVYKKSIRALQILNSFGYGKSGRAGNGNDTGINARNTDDESGSANNEKGLVLNLVYNPAGAFLPPEQGILEKEYKFFLKNKYNIDFNKLLTITNMPVKRFAVQLASEGKYGAYCDLLQKNFNPKAASGIMCRELLSVSWNGEIFNCDFNQALGIPLKRNPGTIRDISGFDEIEPEISFDSHCFGCTAGCGSSCGGALL